MEKELKLKSHITTRLQFGIDFALTKKLPEILENTKRKVAIITDETIEELYREKIEHFDLKIFSISPGETAKTRDTKALLEDHLLAHNFGRDTLIIALGGGVVGDIAGFLASTYCRGVPLVQIPTTLLAMVDAAIGGKNGVNTPYGKNMVGTFYPPKEVLIDGQFLTSLPLVEKTNGLIELLKAALIASPALFEAMRQGADRWLANDLEFQMERIYESAAIKRDIVEADPKEEGLRRSLNLGHTFGHALEMLENYTISHGQAVASGILGSCYISQKMGLLSSDAFKDIQELFELYQIPLKSPHKHTIDNWMGALARDKKAKMGTPRFVLLDKLGSVAEFEGHYCSEVDFPLIEEAILWMS